MAESARRGRDTAHPAVETLEGRTVLSVTAIPVVSPGGSTHLEMVEAPYQGVSADLASPGGSPSLVHVEDSLGFNPRYYVTPQTGEVLLNVTRPSSHARGALTIRVETDASTDKALPPNARLPRVTGNIISTSSGPDGRAVTRRLRTTGPDRSTLPIVPVDGAYRFAPGQTSLTIPIRLNPRFIPPNGNTNLSVTIHDPTAQRSWLGPESVGLNIISGLDQIPPKVIGLSRTPGAITLTFSKPMNPATVEDVTNYRVFSPGDGSHSESLQSAVYNPATQTVTLTPTVPLTQSTYYFVQSASAQKSPTDLQGKAAIFGPGV